jgi:hypothetical protein
MDTYISQKLIATAVKVFIVAWGVIVYGNLVRITIDSKRMDKDMDALLGAINRVQGQQNGQTINVKSWVA